MVSFHSILLQSTIVLKQLKLSFNLVRKFLLAVKPKNLLYIFAPDVAVIKQQRYANCHLNFEHAFYHNQVLNIFFGNHFNVSNFKYTQIILREAERQNVTGKVVNHPDNESYYPIHYAALYNNKRMVEILVNLQLTVILSAKDNGVCYQILPLINTLSNIIYCYLFLDNFFQIRYGVNIAKKNVSGRLPSHFAAEHKDTEILEHLLQYGKIKQLQRCYYLQNVFLIDL